MTKPTNRLARSRSPYLLQHAHNPVDWYPWCPEAFARASAENKPIFLSIGYSTCHWCHVMERESFSDPGIAGILNGSFINIKVDREEHPNIDHIYMAVCQHLTGGGGWPLTIVMTPDRRPFFAGTYFPPESRYERPGMRELLPRLAGVWQEKRSRAVGTANEIVRHITNAFTPAPGKTPDRNFLDTTFSGIADMFDAENGGFGDSPKFPSPIYIMFLLRYWKRKGNKLALQMVYTTLRSMWRSGTYDQLGFGFHRYATDAKWIVPHFEKMISDQALLSMAYTEAYLATGDREFGQAAREILEYMMRDMQNEEGAFYTAEDADSEGLEGRFYTWRYEELAEVLDDTALELARAIFNVCEEGNIPDGHPELKGQNILYRTTSIDELSRTTGIEPETLTRAIDKLRKSLHSARNNRPRPARDEKVLTDLNGLAIAALAKAASAFDDARYADAAARCLDFIFSHMRGGHDELLHSYYQGRVGIPANLDDYANLLWGCMELYLATFHVKHLKTGIKIADEMTRNFWDEQYGGFFFAPPGGDPLPFRNKFANDSATPAGNAVAAYNLLRIGRLTANPMYEEKVAVMGRAFSHQYDKAPVAFTHLASTLDMAFHTSAEVIIAGDPEAPDTLEMISALRKSYVPNMVAAFVPTSHDKPEIADLVPFAASVRTFAGKATAYVCKDFICRAPTTSPREMINTLDDIENMRI
jgi:uncharacterized protein YyaL (SSP411 family)